MHVTESNAAIYAKGNEVPLGMTLVSEKLQHAGYFCVHVGKWHIGSSSYWHIPINRGFNHSFGFLGGSQNYARQTRGNPKDGTEMIDLWRGHGPVREGTPTL